MSGPQREAWDAGVVHALACLLGYSWDEARAVADAQHETIWRYWLAGDTAEQAAIAASLRSKETQ